MKSNLKKILTQSLKVLFAVGIIYWLIQSDKLDFTALKSTLTPLTIASGLGLILVNFIIISERWRLLLSTQKITAAAWPTFKLTLIGNFFNFAMPGGVGGDVVKAFYFAKENPNSRVVALTSVVIDRVLGLFAMILLAFMVMIADLEHILKTPTLFTLFIFISALALGFLIALFLVFSEFIYRKGWIHKVIDVLPLRTKLHKIYESLYLYGQNKKVLFWVLLLSLVAQFASVCFLALVGKAAQFDVRLITYLLVAPLGFMATAIPISPAGVGVGQAAFYFLFNLYLQKDTEIGPTVITAFQVATFFVSLLGAVFYLRRKDRVSSQEIESLEMNS